MFRLRYVSPFSNNGRLLFKNCLKFSSEQKPQENISKQAETIKQQPAENIAKEQAKEENALRKDEKQSDVARQYQYNSPQFQQINSTEFLKRMERIEQKARFDNTKPVDSLKLPILLCLAAAFIYHCWMTIPYNVVYKHTTINEYINQRGYYHALFLSPLSFQSFGHFVIYFPLMVYSFLGCSRFLKQKHTAIVYLTNALVTAGATYYFEKSGRQISNMITPKANGAVTPLCFMSIFLVMKPDHFLFGTRALPYFLIPAIMYMYEYNEYKHHVNEICREAHFTAIGYGVLCGFIFRFLLTKGKL